MTNPSRHRAAAASARLYRYLLKLYPSEFQDRFGVEMAQAFEDLCHDCWDQQGLTGLLFVWPFAIGDLATSAISERMALWKDNMRRKQFITTILGSILLIYSGLFAAINILQYNLGFSTIWNPYQAVVDSARSTLANEFLSGLIIVGPALALLLYLLPLIRVTFDRHSEQMLVIIV
jgi:hypothetical protein